MPTNFSQSKLVIFDLGENDFTGALLPLLRVLFLRMLKLVSVGTMPTQLNQLANLTVLNIANNRVRVTS